ncbi:MAG TPA: hypothetical protein DIT99_09135 [Candidatus Latescibacteria bacterium]|nr:hypothetical protein [Candidatus Latescibacterota bacterium]
MRCPTCGSSDVNGSRRDWFEKIFNGIFWYQRRPYRCAHCMTRFWMRLEASVWRHTFRLRAHKWFREWGFYFGVLLLTLVVVAWSLNFVQSKAESAGSLIDSAINQGLRDRVENLSSEERDSYRKQAEDLSDEQKEQLKKLFDQ